MPGTTMIVMISLVLLTLIVLAANIRVVQQSRASVVERLGAFRSVWGVGLHIKIPFIDRIAKNACEPNVEIEEEVQMDGYRRIRFTFESEEGYRVPCHLFLPDDKPNPPVMRCLQGHSSSLERTNIY